MKKVALYIPILGGMADYEIRTESARSDRYVCSTWDGDGLDNEGEWDIMKDKTGYEYYAIER